MRNAVRVSPLETSDEIQPLREIVGQDSAVEAITGLSIERKGIMFL
jgi:hypothetical protein